MMRARLARVPFLVLLLGGVALLCWLPAAHAALRGEPRVAQAFAQSGLLLLVLAGMLGIATATPAGGASARGRLAVLAGAYLALPPAMALPLVAALPDTSWLNAWFEMLSCFTTTGATVYEPGRLPPSVHLWRALAGWLGGFFALLTAHAVLAPLGLGGAEVFAGGAIGGGAGQAARLGDLAGRLNRRAAEILPVYAGLTLALWVLLMIAREDGLLAMTHAMGTLSTSGVSAGMGLAVTASGLPGEALIFMFLLFALSRRSWPRLFLRPRHGRLAQDPELRFAALIVAAAVLVLVLRHLFLDAEGRGMQSLGSMARAVWGALFTTVSFLTTTGYESAWWTSARAWSGLGAPGMLLLGLAMIGGGVATTAGGVKLLRIHALLLHGRQQIERIVHPSSVGGQGGGKRRLAREGARMAWIFFMLFAISVLAMLAALTLAGLDFPRATVLGIAALTTTGPLAAVAGPEAYSYATLAPSVKVILGVGMVVGRLEILALVALLAPLAWRR